MGPQPFAPRGRPAASLLADRHASPASSAKLLFIAARAFVLALLGALALAAPAGAGLVGPQDALMRLGPFEDVRGLVRAGDVNGDRVDDLAVLEAPGGDAYHPRVRIVFGGPAGGGFTVDGVPDQVPDSPFGLRIGYLVPSSVAGAGDVDGDGLADVVIGASSLGNSLRRRSGSAFVVFGKPDPAPVRLDALGEGGFRVDGPRGGSHLGSSVAGLGDVDGDGLADVAVDAAAQSYVVFGRASGDLVDLRAPGDRAYVVGDPEARPDELMQDEHELASAGDANGDGRGDLAIFRQGRVVVVFGKAGTERVDTERLGAGGYEIGPGGPVRSAGDVDGDGRGDLFVAGGAAPSDDDDAPPPVSYVVLGRERPGSVDASAPGAAGVLRIDGVAGATAEAIGDVDGDRRGDLVFGLPGAAGSCRTGAGGLAVVHGRGAGVTDVRRGGGFFLRGDESRAHLGSHVAAGDFTGDGRPDIAAGLSLPSGPDQSPEDLGPPAVHVFAPADTGVPVPRRGRCLILESLTRSFRRAVVTRRMSLRVTARERGSYLLSVEVVECFRGDCGYGGERPPTRILRLREPTTRTLTFRLSRSFLRELRASNVRGLAACLSDENDQGPCVELPKPRR